MVVVVPRTVVRLYACITAVEITGLIIRLNPPPLRVPEVFPLYVLTSSNIDHILHVAWKCEVKPAAH